MQVEVCKEQVEWARSEKRTFLRQRIEARLANLYLGAKDFSAALALIGRLLTEVSQRKHSLVAQPDKAGQLASASRQTNGRVSRWHAHDWIAP